MATKREAWKPEEERPLKGVKRRYRNVGSTFVHLADGTVVAPGAEVHLSARPVDAPPWLVEER